jgi:hypothetical protein
MSMKLFYKILHKKEYFNTVRWFFKKIFGQMVWFTVSSKISLYSGLSDRYSSLFYFMFYSFSFQSWIVKLSEFHSLWILGTFVKGVYRLGIPLFCCFFLTVIYWMNAICYTVWVFPHLSSITFHSSNRFVPELIIHFHGSVSSSMFVPAS